VSLVAGGAPAVKLGRCNPYGAETGGPKRVLGGLYGPGSAATPGMGLPDNVAQGEWPCDEPAQVRVRMRCRCDHRGSIMELCSWHDADAGHSEIVAGTTRWVSGTRRVRGHYEEIQRRQAGACTQCLFPPWAAELSKAVQVWQAELDALYMMRRWHSPEARAIMHQVEQAGITMMAGTSETPEPGKIHKCPMLLEQVA
jgi:hypothetical protein